jgi:hypothetical protein
LAGLLCCLWSLHSYKAYHAGHRVSVVNPARIKAFEQSELQHTTDRTDAKLIPTVWSSLYAVAGLVAVLSSTLSERGAAGHTRRRVGGTRVRQAQGREVHELRGYAIPRTLDDEGPAESARVQGGLESAASIPPKGLCIIMGRVETKVQHARCCGAVRYRTSTY